MSKVDAYLSGSNTSKSQSSVCVCFVSIVNKWYSRNSVVLWQSKTTQSGIIFNTEIMECFFINRIISGNTFSLLEIWDLRYCLLPTEFWILQQSHPWESLNFTECLFKVSKFLCDELMSYRILLHNNIISSIIYNLTMNGVLSIDPSTVTRFISLFIYWDVL